MLRLPEARLVVENVAVPPALRVAWPILAAPSKNMTVPVGTKPLARVGLTVAVNATAWPWFVGFGDATRVVELPSTGSTTNMVTLSIGTLTVKELPVTVTLARWVIAAWVWLLGLMAASCHS